MAVVHVAAVLEYKDANQIDNESQHGYDEQAFVVYLWRLENSLEQSDAELSLALGIERKRPCLTSIASERMKNAMNTKNKPFTNPAIGSARAYLPAK
jgi:hypothetical protein